MISATVTTIEAKTILDLPINNGNGIEEKKMIITYLSIYKTSEQERERK
jgi:hypothetical protein